MSAKSVSAAITISGNLYASDETTPITSGTIKMSIGADTATTTPAGALGAWSFTNVTEPAAGTVINIWADVGSTAGTTNASLVFKYGSTCEGGTSSCTGLKLFRTMVIIGPDYNNTANSIVNTDLAACDNDTGTGCVDTDIGYTSEAGVLTLTWGNNTLRIKDADAKFAPGGNVALSNFKQSAGSFNGGSGSIDLYTSFILSGGSFTSTSGTMTIENDFTVTGAPTFNANGGIIKFDGTGGSQNSTLACNNITFNLVAFDKSRDGGAHSSNVTIGSGCTIPLGNDPTSNVVVLTNNGAITVGTGTWTVVNPEGWVCSSCGYVQNTGANLTLGGTTIDVNGGGVTFNGGSLTAPSLTNLNITGDFNNSNILPNGLNLTLDGAGSLNSTLTCGTITFNLVTFAKTADGGNHSGDVTVGSGCVLPLGNSPTSTVTTLTNNGTINVGTGTWTLTNAEGWVCQTCGYVQGTTGNLNFTGTTIDINNGGITFNGGNVSAANWTALSLNGDLNNNANKLPNDLTLTLDGTAMNGALTTCGTATFALVIINKTQNGGGSVGSVTVGADCVVPLGNDPTVSAYGLINNGEVTAGGTTLTFVGNTIWACPACGYVQNAGASLDFSGTTIVANNAGLTFSGGTLNAGNLSALQVQGNISSTSSLLPDGYSISLNGGNDVTLICGTSVYSSITINKTGGTTVFGSNCATSGDFTRTDGVVGNSASPYVVTIAGDFAMSTADAFGGANLTIEMTGGNVQTITQNAGSIASPLVVNKTSNAAALSTNLVLAGALTVQEGTLTQGASFNLTTGGVLTVESGGEFRNIGTGDLTLGGNVVNDGTVTINANGLICGEGDDISVTAASSRAWSGSGDFDLFDVALTNQDAAVAITVYSGTNTSGNTGLWTFETVCPSIAFAQNDYRFYQNADAVQPTTGLAEENTPAYVAKTDIARLRMNVGVSGGKLISGSQAFSLQYATDTAGPWTEVNQFTAWYDASWQYRTKITIKPTQVPSAQTNFPVYVNLDDLSDSFFTHVKTDGADIRVTNGEGTELAREVVSIDTVGKTGELWFKADTISDSSGFYIYYGNGSAVEPAKDSTYGSGNVWNSNYIAVYHLQEAANNDAAGYKDSTNNNNHGQGVSMSMTSPDGRVAGGKAAEFDGASDRISVPKLLTNNTWSASAWSYLDAFDNSMGDGLFYQGGGGANIGSQLGLINEYPSAGVQTMFGRSGGDGLALGSDLNYTTGQWHFYAGTFNNTAALFYYDSGSGGSGTVTGGAMPDTPGSIGAWYNYADASRFLDGKIDEIRIQDDVATPDWIMTEYKNQSSTSDFYFPGTEEAHSAAWNFKDNPGVIQGTAITSNLLSTSDVTESYQENNPTIENLNSIDAGQEGEYDFALDSANATEDETYYFRLVKFDGTELDAYTQYPQVTIGAPNTTTFDQESFRWYANADSLTPGSALADENMAYILPSQASPIRLRINIISGSDINALSKAFKLEWSTSPNGGWREVGQTQFGWQFADNPSVDDGASLQTGVLSDTDVMGSYEEANNTASNPYAASSGQNIEYDFVLDPQYATYGKVYYFRLSDSGNIAFDVYTRYPTLVIGADVKKVLQVGPTDEQIGGGTPSSGGTNRFMQRDDSWWDSAWLSRKKITFDNSASTENLQNFPILVSLSASNIDYAKTKDSGQDIRFVDSDGTELPYEIEKWNEAGTSSVWVNIPQVDLGSTTDYIWMYYNNTQANDDQSATTVWNSDYKGIWHLKETPPGTVADSLGVNSGSTVNLVAGDQVPGSVDGSLNFDGSSKYVNIPDNPSLRPGNGSLTVSLWMNAANVNQCKAVVDKRRNNLSYQQFSINIGGSDSFFCPAGKKIQFIFLQDTSTIFRGGYTDNDIVDGSWHYVVGIADQPGDTIHIYVDGEEQTITIDHNAGAWPTLSNTDPLQFANNNAGIYYTGGIDEVRISNIPRTSSWIKAEYLSMSNSMNTFGAEETLSNGDGGGTPQGGGTGKIGGWEPSP